MIFDFILKIIFAMNFHHYADFIMRFDSNDNVYFDNNKLYFDGETIVHNLFDFNDKMYNRFDHIDFDLML